MDDYVEDTPADKDCPGPLLVPRVSITKQCPWKFPDQSAAFTTRDHGSVFYPSGYKPDLSYFGGVKCRAHVGDPCACACHASVFHTCNCAPWCSICPECGTYYVCSTIQLSNAFLYR